MDLLEREREFAALDAALAEARAGRGSVVLVAGEAGIGKTRLIREFTAVAPDDVRVLWGSCDDLSTPRTLGPFRDISRQLGGDFEQAVMQAGTRSQVFDTALASLQSAVPTVAVVEDAHWADTATFDVLKFLGRRIDRMPVLLVISFRTGELDIMHPLTAVIGDLPSAAVRRLDLEPLSEAAVNRLADAFTGPAGRLYTATRGNPFLVTEALATPGTALPGSVRDAVWARTARLSPAARALADTVAVVPGRAERELLGRLGTVDPLALDECLRHGLLEYDESAVWYRHELVRHSVAAGLSPDERRQLNQRHAAALVETKGDVARIVHHAAEARDSENIARYAPIAASEAAAASSHREALAHYRLAAAQADHMTLEHRADVMTCYAVECYLTNEAVEGLEVAEAAQNLAQRLDDKEREGEVLRILSRLNWWLGRPAEAEAAGLAAIELLESVEESSLLPMAYSNMAQLCMLAQRADCTEPWALRAIAAAREAGDQAALSHALNNLGSMRVRLGDPSGWDLLYESLDLALTEGLEDHAGRAYANLIWTALDYRDYPEASRLLDDGLAYATERELTGNLNYMTAERARLRFEQSDWDGAEQDARWVLRRREVAGITKMPALTALARLGVRRGDEDAQTRLDDAWRLAEPTGELQRMGPVALGRAELAWLRGTPAAIPAIVRSLYDLAIEVRQPWIGDELAFWMWRGGVLDVAPTGTNPFVAQIAGNWEGAAAEWERLGCPYEAATARCDSDDAADLLAALATFDTLGALPAARLTRAKLRRLGVKGVPRGPRPATRENPAGLTNRQLDVLGLLAAGLTNAEIADRLFVATKTVDHHVSAVLMKLEVGSRRDAAKRAVELGLTAHS